MAKAKAIYKSEHISLQETQDEKAFSPRWRIFLIERVMRLDVHICKRLIQEVLEQ